MLLFWAAFTARIALGGVFLFAALTKFQHPRRFLFSVLDYGVLSPSLASIYARIVPPLELMAAVLFLAGWAILVACALALLLLASFIAAIGINMARGRSLDCGCFGRWLTRPTGWPLLIEDATLMLLAAGLAFARAPLAITRSPIIAAGIPWFLWFVVLATAIPVVVLAMPPRADEGADAVGSS